MMTETSQQRMNRRMLPACLGVFLGLACWVGSMNFGLEEPDPVRASTATSPVYLKLGAPCALVDDALAERLYGAGKAEDSSGYGSDDENSTCQWSRSPVSVEISADRQDHPTGGEVASAAGDFDADRQQEDEGDPRDGLPEDLASVGDQAYVVYDPKADAKDSEQVMVFARHGNVVVTVEVIAGRKAKEVGRDRLVDEATQFTTAALGRLPKP